MLNRQTLLLGFFQILLIGTLTESHRALGIPEGSRRVKSLSVRELTILERELKKPNSSQRLNAAEQILSHDRNHSLANEIAGDSYFEIQALPEAADFYKKAAQQQTASYELLEKLLHTQLDPVLKPGNREYRGSGDLVGAFKTTQRMMQIKPNSAALKKTQETIVDQIFTPEMKALFKAAIKEVQNQNPRVAENFLSNLLSQKGGAEEGYQLGLMTLFSINSGRADSNMKDAVLAAGLIKDVAAWEQLAADSSQLNWSVQAGESPIKPSFWNRSIDKPINGLAAQGFFPQMTTREQSFTPGLLDPVAQGFSN